MPSVSFIAFPAGAVAREWTSRQVIETQLDLGFPISSISDSSDIKKRSSSE
jgi:hypothetical protein